MLNVNIDNSTFNAKNRFLSRSWARIHSGYTHQPEKNLKYTAAKIPPFLYSAGKPEMTVKRYWSRFKSYLLLTHKIRTEPLITKQKDAVEKNQDLNKKEDKENLELALEAFEWVTGRRPKNT